MSIGSRKSGRRDAAPRFLRFKAHKHSPLFSGLLLTIALAQFNLVQAHDIWLTTVDQAASTDTGLQIGLLIGEQGLPAEALPFNPSNVERLWLTTPHGVHEIPVTGPELALPAAFDSAGTQTLAYIGRPAPSVLPADKFDDYLREEHLQSILQQRQATADPATATNDSGLVTERFSRSLKLLLTDPGQALIDCPVGLPLELSVVTADDAEVVIEATFRGQPLQGAWIDRGAADGSAALAEGVTDANGRVALLRSDGDWVVRTTHMEADDEGRADWRSWWATTSFRLTAAGVRGCTEVP